MKQSSRFGEENIVGMTLASIIPTLVSGLYNDTFDLVREYCQNSYDAILLKYGDSAEVEGRIDITIENQNLIIHDNGTGMPLEIVKKCAVIGFSSKDVNNQVGYRGVGRLSGICAATKMHFVTKVENSLVEYIFEIDAQELVSSLDRDTKFTKRASDVIKKHSKLSQQKVSLKDKKKSYTTVILYGIHGEAGKLLDEDRLREYLEMNLPVFIHPKLNEASKINKLYRDYDKLFPNIPIYLNDKQIYKPYHEMGGTKEYKSLILKNPRGRTLAVVWLIWDTTKSCMVPQVRIRGIRYRNKGFTIGNNGYLKTILNTSPPQVPDWFIGEVIVIDDRAQVSSDRSRFEDTLSRSEIEKALKYTIAKELETIARNKSKNASKERAITKAKTHLKDVKKKNKYSIYISEGERNKLVKESKKNYEKLSELSRKRTTTEKEKKDIQKIKNKISENIKELSAKKKTVNDLDKILRRSPMAEQVHKVTVSAIKRYFKKCESSEELITKIGNDLMKKVC